jgi:hypothetical protein
MQIPFDLGDYGCNLLLDDVSSYPCSFLLLHKVAFACLRLLTAKKYKSDNWVHDNIWVAYSVTLLHD